jgi:hypothetical protein
VCILRRPVLQNLQNETVPLQRIGGRAKVGSFGYSLKGQSNEFFNFFYLQFFHRWAPPSPLLGIERLSNLASNSRRYSRFLVDCRQSLIAGSRSSPYFTAENCDSPLHYGGESLFIRNICINSCLSFNTKSRYSP